VPKSKEVQYEVMIKDSACLTSSAEVEAMEAAQTNKLEDTSNEVSTSIVH
jgi:hypothetical protein